MRPFAAIIIAGGAFWLSALNPEVPAGTGNAGLPEARPFYLPYQYSSFAEDTALYANAYKCAAEAEFENRGTAGEGHVVAGTISHHLFIRNLIAGYFRDLARLVHPSRILLIGPNHHARGRSPVAISALRWRTPFGFVEPDTAAARRIAETGLARIEEEPFVNEHSIGALVPFIRRSFPGAKIVPVIFKKVADRGDCVELGKVLAGFRDSTLVIASLDFSHYKTSAEAEKEDAASLRVLRSFSADRVDKAYVDSRPALATLLSFSREAGARSFEVVQHTNSGILSHKPLVPCTSYINAFITR